MDNPMIPQLRELLTVTGITQKELAEHLGIKPSHINLYFKEKSDIHSRKLIGILEFLGIDLAEIVQGRINELKGDDTKRESSSLYSKLSYLEDYNREPLLKIVKALVG